MVILFHGTPVQAEPIEFARLKLESAYRLEKSFQPNPYFGVIQSRKQLASLWNHLIHAEDEGFIRLHPLPEMPEVDFSKSAVFWFADQGAHASTSDLKSLESKDGFWTATLEILHSDFGSRRLNLWRIPIPKVPVVAKEKHLYDRGP